MNAQGQPGPYRPVEAGFRPSASWLALAMMLALLPESVKLLALKARPGSDERIARILARLQPDLAIEPGTRFTTGNPQQAHHGKRFTPAQLFRGHLMGITPLLWLVYLLSSALIYFMVFWTPMINERMGFSVSAAATSVAKVGAMAGPWLGGVILDAASGHAERSSCSRSVRR
ncbi:hypothetical protein ACFYWN_23160 [Streptomyces sp. NPDC002917]|uniref:hypothetical protein n=1 Tax=unclassified Streptomyces TaxID=2593676 RepID=UPI002E7FFC2E|nr:hypothetical protein [Streptomyces sp. NBC_00562]WTC84068.1 hypothetical protein OH719_43225 [Streptomyces sp. NBC_01653]WTD31214.1 hypothetical protein OHB03_02505 [Streptomyces sp. NBC_01643]WTD86797.1 hypothetical protein OG891_03645 [Streptomyces sp. NBC_01637]WUC17882.1 hypothetical protein OHA33_02745 [Streptomyces sp. NBC_00562]